MASLLRGGLHAQFTKLDIVCTNDNFPQTRGSADKLMGGMNCRRLGSNFPLYVPQSSVFAYRLVFWLGQCISDIMDKTTWAFSFAEKS